MHNINLHGNTGQAPGGSYHPNASAAQGQMHNVYLGAGGAAGGGGGGAQYGYAAPVGGMGNMAPPGVNPNMQGMGAGQGAGINFANLGFNPAAAQIGMQLGQSAVAAGQDYVQKNVSVSIYHLSSLSSHPLISRSLS